MKNKTKGQDKNVPNASSRSKSIPCLSSMKLQSSHTKVWNLVIFFYGAIAFHRPSVHIAFAQSRSLMRSSQLKSTNPHLSYRTRKVTHIYEEKEKKKRNLITWPFSAPYKRTSEPQHFHIQILTNDNRLLLSSAGQWPNYYLLLCCNKLKECSEESSSGIANRHPITNITPAFGKYAIPNKP